MHRQNVQLHICAAMKLWSMRHSHQGFLNGGAWRGVMGAEVPLHNRTKRNFAVYEDRLETNLLQLFVQPKNSEWFAIISAIIFEVNVVAAQKQA